MKLSSLVQISDVFVPISEVSEIETVWELDTTELSEIQTTVNIRKPNIQFSVNAQNRMIDRSNQSDRISVRSVLFFHSNTKLGRLI